MSEQQTVQQNPEQQTHDQQQQQQKYPNLNESKLDQNQSQNNEEPQQQQKQQTQNENQQLQQQQNTDEKKSPVQFHEEKDPNYTKSPSGTENEQQQQQTVTTQDGGRENNVDSGNNSSQKQSQISPTKQLQLENEFQNLKTQEIFEKNQQQQQQQVQQSQDVETSNDIEVVDKKQEEQKQQKVNKIFDTKNLSTQQQQNLIKEQEKIIQEISNNQQQQSHHQQQQQQQQQQHSSSTADKIISILPFFSQHIDYEKQSTSHHYQQYNQNDIQILYEANLERKKQQYEILKKWDQERAQFLNFHRNLIELVQGTVDMRSKASTDIFNSIVKYFQSKFNLELSYMDGYNKWNQQKHTSQALNQQQQTQAQQSQEQLEQQQKQQDPQPQQQQQKNYNSIFSQELVMFTGEDNVNYKVIQIINECEKQNQVQLEKVKKYAGILQNDIIESKLKEHYFEYADTINEIQSSLINLQKQTTKANIAAQDGSNVYASLFAQQVNTSFQHKINKDLHKKLELFLKNAQEQVNFQKLLARETLIFWEKVVDLEKKRLSTYSAVLEIYLNAYAECYGETPFKQQILKEIEELKQIVQDQKVDQCLDLQYILGPDYVKEIYIHLGKKEEEITAENFKHNDILRFFTQFSFQQVDCKLLILKELKAKRNVAQNQGNPATRNFKECKMYVTVDGFLLIYDIPQQAEHEKPVLTIPLTKEQFKFIEDGEYTNVVEVIKHKKGLILTTKEKYELQFENLDILEELVEYVDRMEAYFKE